MNQKHNFQKITVLCLLIAVVGIWRPMTSKADDTATTNAPAPETVTAPETTNTLTTTNLTTSTNTLETPLASVATNAPVTVTGSATTNAPATANVPAPTAAPVPAAAPATNAVAVTKPLEKATKTVVARTPSYQPFNLGAEAGTTGYGGTAGWRLADHFGVAGGMDYLSYSLNRTFNDIPYHAHLRMESEYAALNLYPWRDRSFHFSLGAYFNQNRLTGSAISDGTLTVNGNPVPPGDAVRLEYKQQPVDPYLAIGGNLYFDKAKRFSLGAELGAFYLGNPRVKVSDSEGLVAPSDLAANQQKLEHDLKKIPVWPILKLSFNFSF